MQQQLDSIIQLCSSDKELYPSQFKRMILALTLNLKNISQPKQIQKIQEQVIQSYFKKQMQIQRNNIYNMVQNKLSLFEQLEQKVQKIQERMNQSIAQIDDRALVNVKLSQEAINIKLAMKVDEQTVAQKLQMVQKYLNITQEFKKTLTNNFLQQKQKQQKNIQILLRNISQVMNAIKKQQIQAQPTTILKGMLSKLKNWWPKWAKPFYSTIPTNILQHFRPLNAAQWVDPECYYHSQCNYVGNAIQSLNYCRIYGKKIIQGLYIFHVRVLSNTNIGIGVMDQRQKHKQQVPVTENRLVYFADSFCSSGTQSKKIGKGYKKDDIITVSVDTKNLYIQWKKGTEILHRIKTKILLSSNCNWVPYLFFSGRYCCVRISEPI